MNLPGYDDWKLASPPEEECILDFEVKESFLLYPTYILMDDRNDPPTLEE